MVGKTDRGADTKGGGKAKLDRKGVDRDVVRAGTVREGHLGLSILSAYL